MKLLERVKRPLHLLLSHGTYWYYGRPSRKLIVIGVTGTKGKSTTCRYIASVLQAAGYKVCLLSTVEFQIGDKRWPNTRKMTMLGRGEIHRLLREAVRAGCDYAVVETSSEGILQYRHLGLNYDIGVFTNLGTEHQERHGGFENLRRDKGKMFAAISQHQPKVIKNKKIISTIIVNADDQNASFFMQFPAQRKYSYSLAHNPSLQNAVQAKISHADERGTTFIIGDQSYRTNIVGEFNVYNALAAIAVGESQGVLPTLIAQGIASVTNVPGRMDFIDAGQDFKVIVDYAHEPISYRALFETLRKLVAPGGKVIGIIGSDGGGRDITKRPAMGQVAGDLCDIVIVTDVNCFDEDPAIIAEMLAVGARKAGKKDNHDLFINVNRRAAIAQAFALAKAGDVVAITAKGTESVLCVAHGRKIPWSDRDVARELLDGMK